MRNLKIISSVTAGAVLTLLQFGTANAGQIATPILFLSNNTNQVLCTANNVTGSTVKVTVKIIGVVSGGATETTLLSSDRGGCEVPFAGAGQCRISIAGATNDEVAQRVRGVMITRSTSGPFAIEAVVQAN